MTKDKSEVIWTRCFKKCFENTLDDYPRSRETVRGMVNNLPATYTQGDVYPGINPQVRKIRFPLKEHNIGTRGGLRLIFMALEKLILPVFIYAKKLNYKENKVKELTKKAQSEVLAELRNDDQAN